MERSTGLKTKDILSIIEIGSKTGVKTLKFANLEIEYKDKDVKDYYVTTTHADTNNHGVSENLDEPVSEDLQNYETDMVLEHDFDNLSLEDPELFEELLATEKLHEYGSPTTRR